MLQPREQRSRVLANGAAPRDPRGATDALWPGAEQRNAVAGARHRLLCAGRWNCVSVARHWRRACKGDPRCGPECLACSDEAHVADRRHLYAQWCSAPLLSRGGGGRPAGGAQRCPYNTYLRVHRGAANHVQELVRLHHGGGCGAAPASERT